MSRWKKRKTPKIETYDINSIALFTEFLYWIFISRGQTLTVTLIYLYKKAIILLRLEHVASYFN